MTTRERLADNDRNQYLEATEDEKKQLDELDVEIDDIERWLQTFYSREDELPEEDEDCNCWDQELEWLYEKEKAYSDKVNERNKIEYNIKKRAYSKNYQVQNKAFYYNNDTDCLDSLQRNNQVKEISELLRSDTTKSYFNVGILGKWGCGKSTFMKLLKNDLETYNNEGDSRTQEDNGHSGRLITIWVDASEYENVEKIWYNFLKSFTQCYEKQHKHPKLNFWYKNQSKSKVFSLTVIFLFYICSLLAILANSNSPVLSSISLSSLWLAVSCLVSDTVRSIFTVLLNFAKSFTEVIVNNTELPTYKDGLGERESIKSQIERIKGVWLKENDRIIFFVDELDRCTPEGIFEFFRAVHILSDISDINIVYAINPDNITEALEKENLTTDTQINLFMDKYISLAVRLDFRTDYSLYLEKLFENYTGEFEIFTQNEKESLKDSFGRINCNFLTARNIKKNLNALVLSKKYARLLSEEKQLAIPFDKFVIWFLDYSYYPREMFVFINLMRTKSQMKNYDSYKRLDSLLREVPADEFPPEIRNLNVYKYLGDMLVKNLIEFHSLANELYPNFK